MLALLADGKNENLWKLLTKFNLEKPGKWHFLPNHATIKNWKLMKNDLENWKNLEWDPSGRVGTLQAAWRNLVALIIK